MQAGHGVLAPDHGPFPPARGGDLRGRQRGAYHGSPDRLGRPLPYHGGAGHNGGGRAQGGRADDAGGPRASVGSRKPRQPGVGAAWTSPDPLWAPRTSENPL